MDKERLRFVLEQCYLKQRLKGKAARYEDTARYLGVTMTTLRRWLKGERPVPRQVAIILEIFHAYEVDADRVSAMVDDATHKKLSTL